MDEKRKYPRFDQDAVILYEESGLGGSSDTALHEKPCWLRGVSEGGALLQTEHVIPVGSPLTLQIYLEDNGPQDACLRLQCIARWHKETEVGCPYHVGVEFMNISDEDHIELKAYVERKQQSR